ncbi:phycobiliprotein lyase [Myxosarcina sp. GI1]|uniref:phycobiliprotein lyase n=1 Tax=Myxosarcina sp. GI1 TaxID=1541065 RepID=UPI000569FABA|nr:phycobiliprotein lyase [Myxosarcina sp. GI1]
MNSIFQEFFQDCVGSWKSERTYHYLPEQHVERSQTTFQVRPLTSEQKVKVLTDNSYNLERDLDNLPGFNLGFYTISETGEEVTQNLNLMFVPTTESGSLLEGDYLRDRAYEEARPIISHFRFNSVTKELLMTTNYTKVVSVDSITLNNPKVRIRKILNYLRPSEGQPLENLLLVGFGVELKTN